MRGFFWFLFSYCLAERLLELLISRRNQRAMRARGFMESETKGGMQAMVALHAGWYLCLTVETLLFPSFITPSIRWVALLVFLLAQALRFWTLLTLGRFWNISVLTNNSDASHFVRHGPYRFVRHPNYLVVILELLSLPLVGDAPFTAATFTVANGILLARRIPLEESHLLKIPGYAREMSIKPRFIPVLFARGRR